MRIFLPRNVLTAAAMTTRTSGVTGFWRAADGCAEAGGASVSRTDSMKRRDSSASTLDCFAISCCSRSTFAAREATCCSRFRSSSLSICRIDCRLPLFHHYSRLLPPLPRLISLWHPDPGLRPGLNSWPPLRGWVLMLVCLTDAHALPTAARSRRLQRNQPVLLRRTQLPLGVQRFQRLRQILARVRRFDDVVHQPPPCRHIGIRKRLAIVLDQLLAARRLVFRGSRSPCGRRSRPHPPRP